MRKRKIVLLSALISLFTHAGFLVFSYFVWVPGVSNVAAETMKLFRVKEVDLAPPPAAEQNFRDDYKSYVEQIRFQKPEGDAEQFAGADVMKPKKIVRPEAEQVVTEPEMFQLQQTPEAALEAAQGLPPAPIEVKPLPNLETPKEIAPAPAPAPAEQAALPGGGGAAIKDTRPALELLQPVGPIAPGQSKIVVPDEFSVRLPGLMPEGSGKGAGTGPGSGEGSGPGTNLQNTLKNIAAEHAFKPTPSYESLEEFLGVTLYTYRDPEDGKGYYQLSIFPKPDAPTIEVMPKEIVFLVDASLSIKYRRLEGFKEGIQYAIERLNPDDLFNVFVFKDTVTPMGKKSLRPEPETVAESIRFLHVIQPSQSTDIYKAVQATMKNPPAFHPSYVVLMTDGKPTEGIRSTAALISKITRFNNLQRPIFTFSGGKDVDRFLLDFVAYPNRAWTEYVPNQEDIGKSFAQFYDKIRNPILVNVRYQVTPLDPAEVYPHNLPDFYRDTLFTIYGRFDAETKFSIRITGDIGAKKKEFIFANSLTNATAGTRNIAKSWAFNKIYHLISKMTLEGPNAADKEEIKRLAAKFELNIPYNIDEILG